MALLIAFIEKTYNIKVEMEDVIEAHFHTLKSIESFVIKKLKENKVSN